MQKRIALYAAIMLVAGMVSGCVSQSSGNGEPVGGMVQQHGDGQPEPYLVPGSYH
jgi:hypothetical protein